ncbi:YceI family protein [Streptomyces sp. NPDC002795]|uniref:YceI family protein n=1 Tax=Streptomyces sp. NPDC002795 TaxID=3364665 RepID=UPI0036A2CC04
MFGLWRRNRTNRSVDSSSLGRRAVPPGAGVLSGRIIDAVGEPVRGAGFSVKDAMGRKVVSGGVDPFGSFVATVPAGDYRLAVSAEGYAPFRGGATVAEGEQAELGDVTLQVAAPPALPTPGDWEVEPTHSSVGFTARHIGMARVYGRFNTFAGVLRVGERVEDSAMHVVIDASSIDTNVKMRDDHLRSADFLDVERFPTLEFYSDRFVHKGGSRWAITGALSLHGVTRTVTLDAEYLGVGTGMEGETRAACRASTELHRDDFTVSWQTMLSKGIAVVGSSVRIDLDIQVVPKG